MPRRAARARRRLVAALLLAAHARAGRGEGGSGGNGVGVVAFYYLWYGTPGTDGKYQHWDHEVLPHWTKAENERHRHIGERHKPPDDIHAPFYPARGLYSSADPDVLDAQMAEAADAGIQTLALSWWGPRWREGAADSQGVNTDERLDAVFDAANRHGMRVAIHAEPYPGRTAASFAEDMRYLASSKDRALLNHSAMAKVDGQPLIFVYDSYHIAVADWAQVLAPSNGALRGTEADVFAIGLWLEPQHGKDLARGGFDGAYTYFANEATGFGGVLRHWSAMAREAQHNGLAFVPCVSPGYDDTGIRPWNARASVPRNDGATYNRTWDVALAAFRDAGGVGLGGIGITSWNEWGEGTQIEAAATGRRRPAARSRPPGLYDDYGDDPNMFLNLTKVYVERFQSLFRDAGTRDEL